MLFQSRDYRLFDVIGKGSFGQVYRAMDSAGKVLAIKMIDVESSGTEDILLEIDFLRKLKHPNVLQLYHVGLVDTTVWLVTEYCSGNSLHRILKNNGPPSEATASYILYSLLKAVDYLHNLKIVHRDIKPANIFLDGQAVVKLGDFGVSAQLTETNPMRNSLIGTPFWMAPEVISQSFYGPPADVWAIGVIAIEMVTGETPWSKFKPTQAMMRIVRDEAPVLARSGCPRPGLLSVYYVSLVAQCVIKEPTKRATAGDLVRQKWITRYENPPREFRQLVREQIARQPPLGGACRRVGPTADVTEIGNESWKFDTTIGQPPDPQPNPMPTTMREVRGMCSGEYNNYFDCAFKAVENRSLRAECRIKIERMRLSVRKLDATLSGLGVALLEEATYAQSITAPDLWIEHVFYNVEKRSVKADVKKQIQLVRMSLREIDRSFPGFSKALMQEIQGRIKHASSTSGSPTSGRDIEPAQPLVEL